MDRAIDISNYSGRLNGVQVDWLRDRYDLVIVRLSTEDNHGQREIAAQQVKALADAQLPWQGYLWFYWDVYPGVSWMRAKEMLPDGWPGYCGSGIWLDLEDMPGDHRLAATCLQAYCDILETEGFQPGIYSGSWWVKRNPWLSDEPIARKLSTLPTWWASYGTDPKCDLPLPMPFANLAMHQYVSHQWLGPIPACDESLICRIV